MFLRLIISIKRKIKYKKKKFKTSKIKAELSILKSGLKMIIAIIILRPLFSIDNSALIFEVLNFFFLYFIFLFIEIISLRNILNKL